MRAVEDGAPQPQTKPRAPWGSFQRLLKTKPWTLNRANCRLLGEPSRTRRIPLLSRSSRPGTPRRRRRRSRRCASQPLSPERKPMKALGPGINTPDERCASGGVPLVISHGQTLDPRLNSMPETRIFEFQPWDGRKGTDACLPINHNQSNLSTSLIQHAVPRLNFYPSCKCSIAFFYCDPSHQPSDTEQSHTLLQKYPTPRIRNLSQHHAHCLQLKIQNPVSAQCRQSPTRPRLKTQTLNAGHRRTDLNPNS